MVQTRSSSRLTKSNGVSTSATPSISLKNQPGLNGESNSHLNGHHGVDNEKEKYPSNETHPMIYVVFISLLLDILAFTIILPLFPSLLDHYNKVDGSEGLYHRILGLVRRFQHFVGAPDQFNSVLFGGFLSSMFCYLQFLAAPLVGGFSDVYGRKPAMLTCLVGIALSYILWAISHSFLLFVFARFVGGLSKGNVSLSMSVITDVSSNKSRGIGMALVGIAFSIGFIVGPLIGAMFSRWGQKQTGNWFVYPALFAFGLAIANIIFVALCFKETLQKNKRAKSVADSLSQATSYINPLDLFNFSLVRGLSDRDAKELRRLGIIYFVYLFLYSGLEFTLSFLTHHKFNYTSMQQGWMYFAIGLTMAVLQGGFVRRLPRSRTKSVAGLGLLIIVPSYACVGFATSAPLLYFGLFLYAVSTSMVIPCLTTLVSEFGADNQKGCVLGIFRSLGALARAIGPIVASIAYWSVGPLITYVVGGIFLLWPWLALRRSNIL